MNTDALDLLWHSSSNNGNRFANRQSTYSPRQNEQQRTKVGQLALRARAPACRPPPPDGEIPGGYGPIGCQRRPDLKGPGGVSR